ncbi:hypothetical protein BGZ83_002924 [Gryganskiella cystojenkinii]|nr:hypothetical protein BGZ83_002924 [Gryganskiella cystojenkinii]
MATSTDPATTAKAAVYSGSKPEPPYLTITHLPIRSPTAGEAVVEIVAAHVRSYSYEWFNGSKQFPNLLPMVPGPGAVGIIRSIGPGNTVLQVGQLVIVDSTIRARDNAVNPAAMISGLMAAGPGGQSLQSVWSHGTWTERALVPFENLFVIPQSLQEKYSPSVLTSITGYGVVAGGLLASGLRAGQTIAMTGATGPFGASAIQVALGLGARRVIASGRNAKTLQSYVSTFGPRVVAHVATGDEAQDTELFKKLAGEGFQIDITFDILPEGAPFSTVRAAINAVRPSGTVILMGGLQTPVELPYGQIMFNNLTIKGVFMNPREAVVALLGMLDSGLIDPTVLDIKEFSLDQIEEALQHAKNTAGPFNATVVLPNRTV